MRRSIHFITILCFLSLGCQTATRNPESQAKKPAAPPTTPAAPIANAKPMIDFARGSGGVPLSGSKLPPSTEALIDSLTKSYRERVNLSPTTMPVTASGTMPQLTSLDINLSGGQINPAYRPSGAKDHAWLEPGVLHVKSFSYVATPLNYQQGKTDLHLSASDVTFGLVHSHHAPATLVPTEAKNGEADFAATVSDLREMFLASARVGGSKAGYSVSDVQIAFTSDGPRSLSCRMDVSGYWLLLPAGFEFSGRLDVDDAFNGRLSKISCTGRDVGGAILAGFINGSIQKYDGRVMPLASFPGGKIRIRDVRITVDQSLRMSIWFSS